MLSDGQGWIVDRIAHKMMDNLSDKYDIDLDFYTRLDNQQLIDKVNSHDMTHYLNWDFGSHLDAVKSFTKPLLLSIRSFRYADYVKDLAKRFKTHVVNVSLLEEFPDAVYIPDGLTEDFRPSHPFTVGMAFQEYSRDYKGFYFVKQACDELSINLIVANENIKPEDMLGFYNSVDLMVIASVNEGFNTIAVECSAINKPFITTNVGYASQLNCHKCDRSIESIKHEIEKFYTSPQVSHLTWPNLCERFNKLYEEVML